MDSAEDRELSARISRACIEKGINPALADYARVDNSWAQRCDLLPEDCPIPEMAIYRSLYWPECKGFAIVAMLMQQVGSKSYWVPVEFLGPNLPRRWFGPEGDNGPRGWRISVTEQNPQWTSSYPDLWELSENGWWSTLEEAWDAIPTKYKYYDPGWRQQSVCDTCFCTGVVLHNIIRLPCPDCRLTPDLIYGWKGLMWVPAHTPERSPHARVGATWRWRWQRGYEVMDVLGTPADSLGFCHVGLRPIAHFADPCGRVARISPESADYDLEKLEVEVFCKKVLAHRADRTPQPSWWDRALRRILSWTSPGTPPLQL